VNFQLQRFHPNARVKVHNQSISVMAKMYTAFFLVLFSSVPFMAMSEQIEACDSEECMQNLFAAAGADDNEGLELLQMNSGAFKAAQEAQAAQSTEESEEDGEDSSGDDEEVAEATEEEEAKEGDEEAEDEEAEEGDEEDAEEGDEEADEEESEDEGAEDGAEETEEAATSQLTKVQVHEHEQKVSLGQSASLDEAGYQKVAASKNNEEMAAFIARAAVEKLDFNITDMGGLAGLVPYYSGQKSTQHFERLLIELEEQANSGSFWIRPLNITSEQPAAAKA